MRNLTSLQELLEGVFSWAFLAPISIITSGWFLAHLMPNTIITDQKFIINIKVIKIQASGSQVLLGFASFIITTLLSGLTAGRWMYELVKIQFGIDPGQFKSICMLSSFLTVAWTFLFFCIYYIIKLKDNSSNNGEYAEQISKIVARSRGEK